MEEHKALRKSVYQFLAEASPMAFVVAPVIYSMIIPAILLDIFVSFYQMICFPVYGIKKVCRKDYILLDRHKLKYLNLIERINCDYCGYFNGLIAYVQEISSRTEQYFCPIRHALHIKGLNDRHARFLSYGDVTKFQEKFAQLKNEVCETKVGI